jgi:hypothetical protein
MAIKENSMGFPQKPETRTTIESSNASTEYVPKRKKILCKKDICTSKFIVALLTIAKIWNQPRSSSMDEWIKKMWCIYTKEYYLVIKKE